MRGIFLEKVTRRFGALTAVDAIDLKLQVGEFVTLLGPSGCGKTTTLRMVAGLDQSDGGRISIGDRVVSDPEAGIFVPPDHRQLGMVFQSYAIWPHMSVFENVAYPLRIRHRPAAEIKDRVLAALRLVEMESFGERPAPALSGGQQQRVAIARALVFDPEVLLLDEPLSNLDARLRTQMGDEFRALQKRLGITSLYVTHDQQEAMALSDRVVVMHSGRILQQGAPQEIYYHPASREVAAFFGTPNLLEAKVVSCAPVKGGLFRLTVEGAGWCGNCFSGERFSLGAPALIVLRPESVELTSLSVSKNADQLRWSGRVIDSGFRGARSSVVVDVNGYRFNVETPSLKGTDFGMPVTLIADAAHCWAVRAA